jgi:peptidyl-prolyl cis-trans isomerase SurA
MESEVWNAAKKDSVGLQKYFEKRAADYKWNKRAVATVASSSNKSIVKKVGKYFEKGWNPEKIKKSINKKGKLNVIFTKDTMDVEHQALPKTFDFIKGTSKIYEHNGSYVVVKADEIIESTQKTFEDAKGKVISDYQAFIEENWLSTLHEKYKVDINKEVLESVKKQIHN